MEMLCTTETPSATNVLKATRQYSLVNLSDENFDEEHEKLCKLVGINPNSLESTVATLPPGFTEYGAIGKDGKPLGFSEWNKSGIYSNKGSDFAQAMERGQVAYQFGNFFVIYNYEQVI